MANEPFLQLSEKLMDRGQNRSVIRTSMRCIVGTRASKQLLDWIDTAKLIEDPQPVGKHADAGPNIRGDLRVALE